VEVANLCWGGALEDGVNGRDLTFIKFNEFQHLALVETVRTELCGIGLGYDIGFMPRESPVNGLKDYVGYPSLWSCLCILWAMKYAATYYQYLRHYFLPLLACRIADTYHLIDELNHISCIYFQSLFILFVIGLL